MSLPGDKPLKAKSFPVFSSGSFESTLQQAKHGDPVAVEELFEACNKYLLLIANQNLNPGMLQKFGASDVVQQTMMIANRQLPEFRGASKGEFLKWIKTILANECRQNARRYGKTAKRDLGKERAMGTESVDGSRRIDPKDPHLTPSTCAITEEQKSRVQSALAEMDQLDREVIQLRNWQELSFAIIGQRIGKSEEAARKVWSRAILKLERKLRDMGAI